MPGWYNFDLVWVRIGRGAMIVLSVSPTLSPIVFSPGANVNGDVEVKNPVTMATKEFLSYLAPGETIALWVE